MRRAINAGISHSAFASRIRWPGIGGLKRTRRSAEVVVVPPGVSYRVIDGRISATSLGGTSIEGSRAAPMWTRRPIRSRAFETTLRSTGASKRFPDSVQRNSSRPSWAALIMSGADRPPSPGRRLRSTAPCSPLRPSGNTPQRFFPTMPRTAASVAIERTASMPRRWRVMPVEKRKAAVRADE